MLIIGDWVDILSMTLYNNHRALNEANERADVAQSVERILGKDEVTSSNLVISFICHAKPFRFAWFFYCHVLPKPCDAGIMRLYHTRGGCGS